MALRDAKVAGVFMVEDRGEGAAEILLDYVTPEYRDYKTGRFLLKKFSDNYALPEINRLVCRTSDKKHIAYLHKMGFEKDESQLFVLML